MARRRQSAQQPRRRKAYSPTLSSTATSVKPTGAFRFFANYRLFAVAGALVLLGGYALSVTSGGRASAHGVGGSNRQSIEVGNGVERADASTGDGEPTRVPRTIKQYLSAPPNTVDPAKRYLAVVSTERGDVQVELFPREAPLAVNNFIFLARDGFYDGVAFHRVIPGFVAQAGDPTGTGIGGPGYDLPFEPSGRPFEAGVLAVARPSEAAAPNNGSQFFFALGRQPALDGRSTVIGRVISGIEVLEMLRPRDPQSAPGLPAGDVIRSISIIES
ncbi:MAG: peptidylprolyl isomerase [Dehalococcoidia bacterium]|nr:MAG: peptidylprolyl isomerase [Dehalococcoidia bacterium]